MNNVEMGLGVSGESVGGMSMERYLISKLPAWFDLVRIHNVPIPLACAVAGAYAAPAELGWPWLGLGLASLLGCAATQAFNDYEDRNVDKQNASFRPIPSGRLSPRTVLIGGYASTIAFAAITFWLEPWAVLPVIGVFATTRYYSRLKQSSLIHHLLLPSALSFMPILGSLVVHHEVLPLAIVAAVSIFLLDVNMNIVGTFKDLWDGSAKERVLPVVWGARPAITVALVTGVLGALIPMAAIVAGWMAPHALLPLGLGLLLTVRSRLRLYRTPSAKVGYSAFKSGRLTEYLSFPAVMAGVMPFGFSLMVIVTLTMTAFLTQALIPEARIPDVEYPHHAAV